jgi:hypothetical protein
VIQDLDPRLKIWILNTGSESEIRSEIRTEESTVSVILNSSVFVIAAFK